MGGQGYCPKHEKRGFRVNRLVGTARLPPLRDFLEFRIKEKRLKYCIHFPWIAENV
mgnify:CR=1 FL=1